MASTVNNLSGLATAAPSHIRANADQASGAIVKTESRLCAVGYGRRGDHLLPSIGNKIASLKDEGKRLAYADVDENTWRFLRHVFDRRRQNKHSPMQEKVGCRVYTSESIGIMPMRDSTEATSSARHVYTFGGCKGGSHLDPGVRACGMMPRGSWSIDQPGARVRGGAGFSSSGQDLPLSVTKRRSGAEEEQRRRRRGRRGVITQALNGVDIPTFSPLVVTSIGGIGFLLFRLFAYFRIQYITAAMLARHVPRGEGTRVLDLNVAGGRNLYYLPKDVVQVVAVNPKSSQQLLQNQAVQAGVPIIFKSTMPSGSLDLPSNSVDAVVSIHALCSVSDVQSILREAVRVLKPGKPIIFIENVAATEGSILRAAQQALEAIHTLTGWGVHTVRNTLDEIKAIEELESVDSDMLLEFQDPHIVGIGVKKATGAQPLSSSSSSSAAYPASFPQSAKKDAKKAGFGARKQQKK